jgi:hypothetical protein
MNHSVSQNWGVEFRKYSKYILFPRIKEWNLKILQTKQNKLNFFSKSWKLGSDKELQFKKVKLLNTSLSQKWEVAKINVFTNQIKFLFKDNPDPVEGPVLQEEGLLVLDHVHGIWKKKKFGDTIKSGKPRGSFFKLLG